MPLYSILRWLAFLECAFLVSSAVFSSNEESALDSYINNLIGCKDIPGLGLAVVKDDDVFTKGYGLADKEKQIKATSSTVFCVGSVTKSMTAMLLARLISSGKYRLRWTTKIKDVLGPDYTFIDDCITDSVTLEDILSHRTGLGSADILLQAGIPEYVTREQMMNLHPFGPSGSICASADDMTKWLKLITSKGKISEGAERIISEYVFNGQFNIKSVLNTMWANAYSLTQPQFPVAFDSLGYGYGWFVSYYRGHRVLHHSGSLYGYSCKITYLPDRGSAFVFFTNGPGETKFDETISPVFYYMLDLMLGYPSWLNETTACSYPAPWRNYRSKRSSQDIMLVSGKELEDMDMHTGMYSHPLYGNVTITIINNTLHISYGLLLTGKLIPTSSSFQLQLFQPLRDVFLSILNVSFQNLSIQNKYQNIEFLSLFEKYTFQGLIMMVMSAVPI
ncbi:unnamed protein product [Mytilus edulis]|uniref:Beta-lactamase-related domain-containing protein n=1 Tax=Mytilus edulis TaxID=6550 RepID=A0A8S3QM83_MYTED|nr:unnamed protein product [Mytilus edulis]